MLSYIYRTSHMMSLVSDCLMLILFPILILLVTCSLQPQAMLCFISIRFLLFIFISHPRSSYLSLLFLYSPAYSPIAYGYALPCWDSFLPSISIYSLLHIFTLIIRLHTGLWWVTTCMSHLHLNLILSINHVVGSSYATFMMSAILCTLMLACIYSLYQDVRQYSSSPSYLVYLPLYLYLSYSIIIVDPPILPIHTVSLAVPFYELYVVRSHSVFILIRYLISLLLCIILFPLSPSSLPLYHCLQPQATQLSQSYIPEHRFTLRLRLRLSFYSYSYSFAYAYSLSSLRVHQFPVPSGSASIRIALGSLPLSLMEHSHSIYQPWLSLYPTYVQPREVPSQQQVGYYTSLFIIYHTVLTLLPCLP